MLLRRYYKDKEPVKAEAGKPKEATERQTVEPDEPKPKKAATKKAGKPKE